MFAVPRRQDHRPVELAQLLQQPVVLHVVAGELHDVGRVAHRLDVGDVGDRRGDRQAGLLAQRGQDRDLGTRRAVVRVVLRRRAVVQQRHARRGERPADIQRGVGVGRAGRAREHREVAAADPGVTQRHDRALVPGRSEGAFLWAHAAEDAEARAGRLDGTRRGGHVERVEEDERHVRARLHERAQLARRTAEADRHARGPARGDDPPDRVLHLRMAGLADDAEAGGEVERPDDDRVEPRGRRDVGDVLDAGGVLDHRERRDARVRLVEVAGEVEAVARRAPHPDAALALRGVPHRADRGGRLRAARHAGHLDPVHAELERLLDDRGVVRGDADDRVRGRGRQRLDDRTQRRQRERTVLGVDDDVVEAGGAEERRQPGLGKRQDRPGEGLGRCKAGTQARELGGHQSFRRPACSSSGRTASA